jgi:septin 2
MEEIEANGIRIYPLPDCDSDEDEEYKEQVRQLKEAVPFAVCGANTLIEVKGRKVRGRQYPWGVVEVENPEHCDFIKLRTMLMYELGNYLSVGVASWTPINCFPILFSLANHSTHMQDLQEVTQDVHYENYRSERLAKGVAANRKPAATNSSAPAVPEFTEKERMLQVRISIDLLIYWQLTLWRL